MYGLRKYIVGYIRIGPRYSTMKTVRHAICGPRSFTVMVVLVESPALSNVVDLEFGTRLPSSFAMRSLWTEYPVAPAIVL